VAQLQPFNSVPGARPVVEQVGKRVGQRLAVPSPPLVLHAGTTHDGLKPRTDRFGIANGPDMAHRGKARLLNGVFGIRAVAEEAHRGREEVWPMAFEQESERGAIATSRRIHQVGVSHYWTGMAREVLHTTMMRDGPEKFDRKSVRDDDSSQR